MNGRVAYWYTGEGVVNEQKVCTFRYALCESGRLYQILTESFGISPLDDPELVAISASFETSGRPSTPSQSLPADESLAYRIGAITGFLLMLILAALVAGAFWGFLYLWKRDLLVQITSHSFWSAVIFAVAPVQ